MRTALDTDRLRRLYGRLARRYDAWHGLLTARSDQRGRALLVARTVRPGDVVLDCGAGTGSTALLAARAAGSSGRVVLFDLTGGMLDVARAKLARAGLARRTELCRGDMAALPFDDGAFDVVLSTYSLCPVSDPVRGAEEMLRVTRPGGLLGIAHSTEPQDPLVRALGTRVEEMAWRFPYLSMGCRAVDVLPALVAAGAMVRFDRRIGVPLWPFRVFVVQAGSLGT